MEIPEWWWPFLWKRLMSTLNLQVSLWAALQIPHFGAGLVCFPLRAPGTC